MKIWLWFIGIFAVIYLSNFIYIALMSWFDNGEIRFSWFHLIAFITLSYMFLKLRKKPNLSNITINNIEKKMNEVGFNKSFIEEIKSVLDRRLSKYGEQKFQEWFGSLNYSLPEEFNDETVSIKLYEEHSSLVEEQVKKLEKESKLTWGEQTVDLIGQNEKSRKVKLVIRHRLSDIMLDLLN
ncbi:hypothetical protein [Alkalihalophilus marmarensis]|uniref:hypothetical protein n=1 Tax=Alkalihalophilus marmarensis TaxID=521377 RepID=UPI002DB782E8|nr:hypothetical protein [Alkalihalophilus marmarensis]MEC2073759.1 hypothetical protein [Alkalihalophilus marmarensis]